MSVFEDTLKNNFEVRKQFLKETKFKGFMDLFEETKKLNPNLINHLYENDFAKFFFDNLISFRDTEQFKNCFYHNVFEPVFSASPIDLETGLEQKFGGEKPFFTEGENWPVYTGLDGNQYPYDFLCQYIDPLEKNKSVLVRIFLPISDNDKILEGNVLVRYDKLDFNDETIKNQIIIQRPNAFDNDKYMDDDFQPLKPYEIKELKQRCEIIQFEEILERFQFPKYNEDPELYNQLDNYYFVMNNDFKVSKTIKIGGTRAHWDTIEWIEPENIFQLVESDHFPYTIGWGGISHLTKETYRSETKYLLTYS